MRISPENRAKNILAEEKIIGPPIRVESIVKKFGITIKITDLPENISGMLHKPSSTIFVNEEHSKNRQRFTIAHELGHFFLSSFTEIHVDKQIGFVFRDEKSKEAIWGSEIAANRFAAELLMPREMVIKEVRSIDNSSASEEEMVHQLATTFRVSEIAMTYKLKNLGLIV